MRLRQQPVSSTTVLAVGHHEHRAAKRDQRYAAAKYGLAWKQPPPANW
jgi:hypothetical protein